MNPIVRLATTSDAPAVLAIYAPFVRETAVSFETEVPTAADMTRRIESTLAERPWLVAEYGAHVIGYAYAGRHRERAAYRWCAEVSAYVASDWHGRGVGRGLYTSLLAILDLLGYERAVAGITLPNEASIALHRSFRFEPVGVYTAIGHKFGAWHDVAWFQRGRRRLADLPAEPPAPRMLADIVGSAAFEHALRAGAARVNITR